MNILVSCNDAYVMPTLVMLTSLLTRQDKAAERGGRSGECGGKAETGANRHIIYMLESSLSEEASAGIASCVSRLGAEYRQIHVGEELFASARTRSYISKETYFRLLAGQLLPADADRVLWLDSDLFVRRDIGWFYSLPFGESAVIACGYGVPMQGVISRNAAALGMSSPQTYFNAGVMLMDLAKWRTLVTEDALQAAVRRVEERHGEFPGQDVTNLLMDGHVQLADYRRCNCMIHCIADAADLEYAKEHADIVHFPGQAKPWKFHDIHFAEEWMQWYRQCFGEEAGLRRMSYFRIKAMLEKKR